MIFYALKMYWPTIVGIKVVFVLRPSLSPLFSSADPEILGNVCSWDKHESIRKFARFRSPCTDTGVNEQHGSNAGIWTNSSPPGKKIDRVSLHAFDITMEQPGVV